VGNPLDAATVIGPLINHKQYETLEGQVNRAVAEGAELLCGGYGNGLCYHPTVLGNVREDMSIFHEETFGPVAPIIVAEDADDALRLANSSAYGLSAGILTNNMQQGLALARRIESGACHVNDSPLYGETHAPLGGVNNSGWGKFGIEAMHEFTEQQWVTLEMETRQYPF
jgi:4-hydroxybenzaldehyde dehydrogenase (EC 1.2.1.64)